ncbi:uncharacterized protein ATNIH1004_007051 [Aspergillus tanneri]|uniref:Major facilitator superfamily (MFS) profile domain-containing protein n=1 Tax=Aspergillus tanneri TaxID=1220188 RepID=A0A5M9MF77_9EURO|nr:uncharacterized protein ATNIH1004_007051 [Aspergillus tanneri]KAA8645632.1 hypothetical protein ATNIH1004_007051 [Aspergillus tanneri]
MGDNSVELSTVRDGLGESSAACHGIVSATAHERTSLPGTTSVSQEPADPIVKRNKIQIFAIMVALCLSTFIAALDQTIVSTALPTISSRLHSASGYTWVGGAYLLANAAAAPIWAKLRGEYENVNRWSSIARYSGGGGLLQLAMIVVSDLFSVRERGLYMGILGFMWTISGGLGPILGGVFAEYVSWRWNFWINLPICGLNFGLLFLYLDVHNPRTKAIDGLKAIDWVGSFSILGLTLMLLLGLNFGGETFAWDSPQVICLIVFGSLFSIVFVYGEKYFAKYPLMPLRLFQHRSNVAVSLVTFFHGFVIVAEGLFSALSGWLIHRTGKYLEQIWIGAILLTLGTGLFTRLVATSSLVELIIFQIIAGAGSAILFEPPLIALHSVAAQEDTASGTAMVGFIKNIAMSTSIVVGGVVFGNSMTEEKGRLQRAGLKDDEVERLTGVSAAASTEMIKTIADPAKVRTIAEAFASSLRNIWIMYACVAGLAMIASVFIVKQTLSEEHTETRTGLKEE